jgi:3-oxoacyl-[acyl-carrier protein] reductase
MANPIQQPTKEDEMEDLIEKTALVTGASRGIGRAIAERLARDGAHVAIHYGTREADAQAVVDSIERNGGQAFAIATEFGVDGVGAEVETLFRELDAMLVDKPLDILVNNAGILDATPIEAVTPDAFERTFEINVEAPFFIVLGALPRLQEGGRIINISSATTRIASPFLHYAMSKGAIDALSRTLAQQLGPRGITVNSVAAGVVDTDTAAWLDSSPEMRAQVTSTIALGRIGEAADIADVVAFLASDDARWITGQSIEASGGQWLGPGG